jgi:hypothetical protein
VPVRLLREAINTSDRVDKLEPPTEVFYRRLMSHVDDWGTFDARPTVLMAALYPLRLNPAHPLHITSEEVAKHLLTCERAGLLVLYRTNGKPFGLMRDTRWQTRSKPKHPLPTEEQLQTSANRCLQPFTSAHLDVVVDVVVVVDVGVVVEKHSDPSLRSGSGALAPIATPADQEKERAEAKAGLWAKAKEVLIQQGMGKKNTGAFIGMLIKNHGEEQVLSVLRNAVDAPPADLKAWLVGTLRPKPETRTAQRLQVAEESRRLRDGRSDEVAAERDVTGESQRVA